MSLVANIHINRFDLVGFEKSLNQIKCLVAVSNGIKRSGA